MRRCVLRDSRFAASSEAGKTGIRSVNIGNNSFNGVTGFDAAPGYNLATGWGTPVIADFVRAYARGRGG